VKSFRPIQRVGTLEDIANAAEYLASDLGERHQRSAPLGGTSVSE
jgi:hypothetical protein